MCITAMELMYHEVPPQTTVDVPELDSGAPRLAGAARVAALSSNSNTVQRRIAIEG